MNTQTQPQGGHPGTEQTQPRDGYLSTTAAAETQTADPAGQKEALERSIKPCETGKPFVFISYSVEDSEVVLKDVQELQRRRYNIWLYQANRQSTNSSWTTDTCRAINNACCSLVVFYVSSASLCSGPCLKELRETVSDKTRQRHLGKPVEWIAVEAEPVEGDDIGVFIESIQRQLLGNSELSEDERNERASTLFCFKTEFFPDNERNRIRARSAPKRRREAYDSDIEADLPRRDVPEFPLRRETYYSDIEADFRRCGIEPPVSNKEEPQSADSSEGPAPSPDNPTRRHSAKKSGEKIPPREQSAELDSISHTGSEDAAKAETSGKLGEGAEQGSRTGRMAELRRRLSTADPQSDPQTDPVRSAVRTLKEYAESIEELIRLEQWDLAQFLIHKADALIQNGSADQAPALLRRALDLFQNLRQEDLTQEDLAQVYTLCRRLGTMEAEEKAWTEAVRHCKEAVDGFEKLSGGGKDPQSRRSYYLSCYSLAEVYRRAGDPAAGEGEADQRRRDLASAFDYYSRGLKCNQELLKSDAAIPEDREAWNLVCGQIARVLELQGKGGEARQWRQLAGK